ncbi:MAG: hypothetical protein JST91_27515 [Actinobacteria bacterium]|nr:hypothetical protein [Actinomycetota bacterium]
MDESAARTGIPKEAWAAIGVIGAAAVTGAVSLVVNLGHAAGDTPAAPAPMAASETAAPPPSPVAVIMGSWRGVAETGEGRALDISLDIDRACEVGELCGAIGISTVPCYGQVFLDADEGGELAFRVANFDDRSDRTCQEGGGELFRLRPDGKLAYRTTYEPTVTGVLEKTRP